jgi:hypothetical protein
MAYSTSNPPALLTQTIGDTAPAIWTYASADSYATVAGAGYFTNGGQLGMKLGDLVFVFVTGGAVSSGKVITVSATAPGAATISSTGSTIGSAT